VSTAEPLVSDEAPAVAAFRKKVRDWLDSTAPAHGWLKTPGATRRRVGVGDEDAVARNHACQKALFDAGFAGLSWPKEYGGQGLALREQIIFNEESSKYDLPLAIYIIGLGMCGPTLLAVGSEEQKQRYIPPMLRGEEVWCQLFSEPGAGSDVAGLTMRAVRDGDEWVLNGQKIWTSGAHHCQFGIVLARSNPDVPKHKGLTMFVVDLRSAGISIKPIRQIDGGEHFNEVFFDDVRVPDANVLGGVERGWQAATATLMNERMSIGSRLATGFPEMFEFCSNLMTDDGLAIDDRATRSKLASWAVKASGLKYTSYRAISSLSKGERPGPENSIGKLVSGSMLQDIAAYAMDLEGAAGALTGADEEVARGQFQQMLLSSPSMRIAGGTDEILRNIIAERVLGLPGDIRVDKDVPFNKIPTKGR
jgi:alkylation response protein AidB-like acyl-CoA dehydrogenase